MEVPQTSLLQKKKKRLFSYKNKKRREYKKIMLFCFITEFQPRYV
jgi:hypothetical protein